MKSDISPLGLATRSLIEMNRTSLTKCRCEGKESKFGTEREGEERLSAAIPIRSQSVLVMYLVSSFFLALSRAISISTSALRVILTSKQERNPQDKLEDTNKLRYYTSTAIDSFFRLFHDIRSTHCIQRYSNPSTIDYGSSEHKLAIDSFGRPMIAVSIVIVV